MQYKGIDIVKFIMALLVVVLHTHPLYAVNRTADFLTADVMARAAVPFFFAATGFLLEKQINERHADIRVKLGGYIRKVLVLYGIWTVVYLPIIIYNKFIISGETFAYSLFTMIRDFFFAGSYGQLWYLPAVAVGVLAVFVLRKYLGERGTAVILFLLFCMGLATQSYFGLTSVLLPSDGALWKGLKAVKKVMVTCRNGIFFGSIFIYMGTWIARRDIRMKGWKAAAGLAVSAALFCIEASCLWSIGSVREKDMYLMLLPVVFFLMICALQIRVGRDTVFLRKMSINIYLVHTVFKFVYREFIGEHNENGLPLFLFTLAGTLITAYLIERFERRRGRSS
ncbi:MAG: acyltransferase [Eubacterium sp.]|nr:acyltransferase [Eubacterium sp.]